ncbi:MAG: Rrf2 family transcriptional regulator [Candidatus Omnitrophota bacterium]
MKFITRDSDYALRALCYIASNREVVKVDELVANLGVPRPFMRKILQKLNKSGILGSTKGQHGGFRLKRPAAAVSVFGIMRIFQGKPELSSCFLKKEVCPERPRCALRKKLCLIEKGVFRQLKEINIASLIKAGRA